MAKNEPTIHRAPKDKEHPYVMISRALIDDESISSDLKILLIYSLSKPFDWSHNVTNMANKLQKSRNTIYKLLKEGIKSGYLTRTQEKKGSRFQSVKYMVHEEPIKIMFSLTKNEHAENEHAENWYDTKEGTYSVPKGTSYEESNDKNKNPLPPEGESEFRPFSPVREKTQKISHGERVKLLPSEYDELCKEHTKATIDNLIVEMNDYCLMHGKTYTSYAAALRSWINRRIQFVKNKPKTKAEQTQDLAQKNKALAQEIKAKYHSPTDQNMYLSLKADGVHYGNMSHPRAETRILKYTELGFNEQFEKILRMLDYVKR